MASPGEIKNTVSRRSVGNKDGNGETAKYRNSSSEDTSEDNRKVCFYLT